MPQHSLSEIIRYSLDMATMLDALSQQPQKRVDSWVFVLSICTVDSNVPIIVQVECDLVARIDPKGLADGLGRCDLPFGCDR